MSDIKAGDLVMVVRGMPCCGGRTGAEGMWFIVSSLEPVAFGDTCRFCMAPHNMIAAWGCAGRKSIELPRLKKIDPPAIPESITENEELTA